ncbi:hypothetical protein UlMin_014655 [Ulmus minor]
MAEENTNLRNTPTALAGDYSRRNSTGKIVSSKSGETSLPRYLRASTGSCHDFCKYGRKHASEGKARHSLLKRGALKPNASSVESVTSLPSMARLKASPGSGIHSPNASNIYDREVLSKSLDSQNFVKSRVLIERKKTPFAKPNVTPSSKSHLYNTPKTLKQESSPSEKLEVSSKPASTEAKGKNLSAKRSTSLKPKSSMVKPLSFSKSFNEMKTEKRTGNTKVAVKKVLESPTASLSPRSSLNRLASTNERKPRSLKKVVPLKNQNKIKVAEPRQPEVEEVQEKTLHVIKMETEKLTLESDQNENCAMQVESLANMLSSSPESSSLPFCPSPSSPPNCPSPSSLPICPSPSSLPTCSSPSSPEEDQQESEYTTSESEYDIYSEDDEMESTENTEALDVNNKTQKRSGLVCAEDKDEKASKLKFRRGKVVELQTENNGPRKLKFRRGRVLGENQNVNGDTRKSRFKRREEVSGDSTETGAEKIVLRHQDVQGKKEEQGLFNNVIEETASKLVETRKSKVKALVGAFETVISLGQQTFGEHSHLSRNEASLH